MPTPNNCPGGDEEFLERLMNRGSRTWFKTCPTAEYFVVNEKSYLMFPRWNKVCLYYNDSTVYFLGFIEPL